MLVRTSFLRDSFLQDTVREPRTAWDILFRGYKGYNRKPPDYFFDGLEYYVVEPD